MRRLHLTLLTFLVLPMGGCSGNQSSLSPSGVQAEKILSLFKLFFYVSLIVFFLVLFFLVLGCLKRRRPGKEKVLLPDIRPEPVRESHLHKKVLGFVVLTVVILFVLLLSDFFTGRAMHSLPQAKEDHLIIQVTGKQWWWEVQYQNSDPSKIVTTANEIHIPVGKVIEFKLKASDVIHSFWAPNFHGKKDLIPGHPTTLWLRADKAGQFKGQCAEFCGHQHAHMRFDLIAEEPQQFQSWLEQQQKSAPEPQSDSAKKGKQVFLTSQCVMCHTILGTEAGAKLGPDLTHIASRPTLAAGTIPNNRGYLAGWIMDPQHFKPGVRMPPNILKPEDIHALLDYLESLK